MTWLIIVLMLFKAKPEALTTTHRSLLRQLQIPINQNVGGIYELNVGKNKTRAQ